MELRLWLDANQYRIDREELVVDRDRIYVIIRAVPEETDPVRCFIARP